MKTLDYHPAANIFPLDEGNLDELARDIREHDQQVPIELLDGKIIDGRRRYLACQKAGVKPVFKTVSVSNPITYVVSLNLHRRHLTISQLAICAALASELMEQLENEARERMQAGKGTDGSGGRGHKRNPPATLPDGLEGETRDKIGQVFGIGGRTVGKATKVVEQGERELIEAVKDGDITVNAAEKVAGKSPKVQREAIEEAKTGGRKSKSPEPEEELEDSGERKVAGVGVIRAHEAINSLIRIPKNDQLRKRGFQIVTDWIRDNK